MAETQVKQKKKRYKVVTPIGRLSYPYLATPDQGREYSDDKYKTDILFPKDTFKEEGAKLRKACILCARDFFDNQTMTLKSFKHPIKDGDEKDMTKESNKHYANCYYITAKTDRKPMVLDARRKEMSAEDIAQLKGGDYARVVLSIFGYPHKGGGVSAGLQVVQFAKEGEAFGGDGRQADLALLDDLEVELDSVDDLVDEAESLDDLDM